MNKVILLLGTLVLLLIVLVVPAAAKEYRGIMGSKGVPLYVIIEVDWDGTSDKADWTVWGPKWDPSVGDILLTSCTNCLDANYEFVFRGKTVHLNETYVPTVNATPQVRRVVLHDGDGDGTYTGSLAAEHYFPWRAEADGSWPILYFDRIDYDVSFDQDGNVTDFHYLQYEHKKLP